LFRSEIVFRTTRALKHLFFLSRKARIFFPEFNIKLYDKNSESDYYFFPPPKSEYFFPAFQTRATHRWGHVSVKEEYVTLLYKENNNLFVFFYNFIIAQHFTWPFFINLSSPQFLKLNLVLDIFSRIFRISYYGFFLKKIFWFPMLQKKVFWFWWRKKIIIWFRV
jgi:hypothetical protein